MKTNITRPATRPPGLRSSPRPRTPRRRRRAGAGGEEEEKSPFPPRRCRRRRRRFRRRRGRRTPTGGRSPPRPSWTPARGSSSPRTRPSRPCSKGGRRGATGRSRSSSSRGRRRRRRRERPGLLFRLPLLPRPRRTSNSSLLRPSLRLLLLLRILRPPSRRSRRPWDEPEWRLWGRRWLVPPRRPRKRRRRKAKWSIRRRRREEEEERGRCLEQLELLPFPPLLFLLPLPLRQSLFRLLPSAAPRSSSAPCRTRACGPTRRSRWRSRSQDER